MIAAGVATGVAAGATNALVSGLMNKNNSQNAGGAQTPQTPQDSGTPATNVTPTTVASKDTNQPPAQTHIPSGSDANDPRAEALRQNDYRTLGELAEEETDTSGDTDAYLRSQVNHFGEALNAAANVANDQSKSEAAREDAREYARSLKFKFHLLKYKLASSPPELKKTVEGYIRTCELVSHGSNASSANSF